MIISVVGVGYVGLVQAVGLANLGHHVTAIDKDPQKIASLSQGHSPIYEPGLKPLLKKAIALGRLKFTQDFDQGLKKARLIFIAVGTPTKKTGEVQLSYINQALGQVIAAHRKNPKQTQLIVIKSTVPVGTNEKIRTNIKRSGIKNLLVASNPEFLREGQAVNDFFNPDRIVIGINDPKAVNWLKASYRKLNAPVLVCSLETAELIKYAVNAYLATSISFINSLSWLSEALGTDITQITQAMRLDHRIGSKAFLDASPGFGGSCFPKDIAALVKIAADAKTNLPLVAEATKINRLHQKRLVEKISQILKPIANKTVAIWGLSFKPMTDDIRESPAINIIKDLLQKGAKIQAYDPASEAKVRPFLPTIGLCNTAIEATRGANLLVVMTAWPEFRKINLRKIISHFSQPQILDPHNIFNPDQIKKIGFKYIGIGR